MEKVPFKAFDLPLPPPLPLGASSSSTEVSGAPKLSGNTVVGFLRRNAKLIVGLILVSGLCLAVAFELRRLHNEASSLKEALSTQRAQQQQAMQEMSSSFESQREAQRQVDRKFEDRLIELNAQYASALQSISQARRVRQRQIESNPSTLPSVFETTFGIRPVPSRVGSQQ